MPCGSIRCPTPRIPGSPAGGRPCGRMTTTARKDCPMIRDLRWSFALLCVVALSGGCGGSKPPPHTGFLSDYSMLRESGGDAARYVSPDLKNYSAFIIDPV